MGSGRKNQGEIGGENERGVWCNYWEEECMIGSQGWTVRTFGRKTLEMCSEGRGTRMRQIMRILVVKSILTILAESTLVCWVSYCEIPGERGNHSDEECNQFQEAEVGNSLEIPGNESISVFRWSYIHHGPSLCFESFHFSQSLYHARWKSKGFSWG